MFEKCEWLDVLSENGSLSFVRSRVSAFRGGGGLGFLKRMRICVCVCVVQLRLSRSSLGRDA